MKYSRNKSEYFNFFLAFLIIMLIMLIIANLVSSWVPGHNHLKYYLYHLRYLIWSSGILYQFDLIKKPTRHTTHKTYSTISGWTDVTVNIWHHGPILFDKIEGKSTQSTHDINWTLTRRSFNMHQYHHRSVLWNMSDMNFLRK